MNEFKFHKVVRVFFFFSPIPIDSADLNLHGFALFADGKKSSESIWALAKMGRKGSLSREPQQKVLTSNKINVYTDNGLWLYN